MKQIILILLPILITNCSSKENDAINEASYDEVTVFRNGLGYSPESGDGDFASVNIIEFTSNADCLVYEEKNKKRLKCEYTVNNTGEEVIDDYPLYERIELGNIHHDKSNQTKVCVAFESQYGFELKCSVPNQYSFVIQYLTNI